MEVTRDVQGRGGAGDLYLPYLLTFDDLYMTVNLFCCTCCFYLLPACTYRLCCCCCSVLPATCCCRCPDDRVPCSCYYLPPFCCYADADDTLPTCIDISVLSVIPLYNAFTAMVFSISMLPTIHCNIFSCSFLYSILHCSTTTFYSSSFARPVFRGDILRPAHFCCTRRTSFYLLLPATCCCLLPYMGLAYLYMRCCTARRCHFCCSFIMPSYMPAAIHTVMHCPLKMPASGRLRTRHSRDYCTPAGHRLPAARAIVTFTCLLPFACMPRWKWTMSDLMTMPYMMPVRLYVIAAFSIYLPFTTYLLFYVHFC